MDIAFVGILAAVTATIGIVLSWSFLNALACFLTPFLYE
jgi:hypothetical protein